jgi:hemerythrin
MELFQWKSEYEIGLPEIDAQHRTLVDMLNQLYAAKRSDAVHQVIEETLDRLMQYTRVHFSDEEAAMREVNYPYLDKQSRKHLDMTDQVVKMRDMLRQGNEPATFELLNFMSDWWKTRITGDDQKFGDFMRE